MIFRNWHLRRIIYLVFGLAFFVQLIIMKEWWMLLIPAWMITMSVFNLGCYGNSCSVPRASARRKNGILMKK